MKKVLFYRLISAVLVVAIITGVSLMYAYNDEGLTSYSKFYVFKRVSEKIRTLFIFSAEKKVEFYARLAERRLGEVKLMLSQKAKTDNLAQPSFDISQLLADAENNTALALESVEDISDVGITAQVLVDIQSVQEKHIVTLEQIAQKTPTINKKQAGIREQISNNMNQAEQYLEQIKNAKAATLVAKDEGMKKIKLNITTKLDKTVTDGEDLAKTIDKNIDEKNNESIQVSPKKIIQKRIDITADKLLNLDNELRERGLQNQDTKKIVTQIEEQMVSTVNADTDQKKAILKVTDDYVNELENKVKDDKRREEKVAKLIRNVKKQLEELDHPEQNLLARMYKMDGYMRKHDYMNARIIAEELLSKLNGDPVSDKVPATDKTTTDTKVPVNKDIPSPEETTTTNTTIQPNDTSSTGVSTPVPDTATTDTAPVSDTTTTSTK